MAETFNDDDQAQQLKEWWKQNWQPILLGLGLSVGGVLGWNSWQSHKQNVAELASGHYEQLRLSLSSNNLSEAKKARQELVDEYANTPYAAQAGLLLAQYYVDISDYDGAIAQLQWVNQQADDKRLRQLAGLRLARLQWVNNDIDAALAQLEGSKQGAFAPLYAELRGDILLAQGETEQARAAYQQALALSESSDTADPMSGFGSAALKEKLNDLGAAVLPGDTPNPVSDDQEAS